MKEACIECVDKNGASESLRYCAIAKTEITCGIVPEGGTEDFCDDCGGENVVWFAPNQIWNKVVRNPEKRDPMLCPRCFILRCEKVGIHHIWSVNPVNRGGE